MSNITLFINLFIVATAAAVVVAVDAIVVVTICLGFEVLFFLYKILGIYAIFEPYKVCKQVFCLFVSLFCLQFPLKYIHINIPNIEITFNVVIHFFIRRVFS